MVAGQTPNMELFGKKVECKACGAKFKSEEELMEHGKMHMGETHDHSDHEHFACKACGVTFHSEVELKEHGQKHHM
ncbi:zinc finger C2H2 domain-containing protein [Candidatus Nitrososphaera gargensis Ga9.2]|uniref:Zinc finger C2H2 domain-containing protein n=2 Tax=Candidatus Nitrososphaera gargensis TaxID=497727 RepID=K0IKG4_NITGG|nr:zinc finger C2H2 domain-containing protein [Candidatus Nitrososphaera gargensis Ga9.2]